MGGTVDQQPTPPAEVNADEAPAEQTPQQDATAAPALPRRTPGAQEMPGKPIEQTDSGGGWFTEGPTPTALTRADRTRPRTARLDQTARPPFAP